MPKENVKRYILAGLVAIVLLIGLYYPLPFYISQPGEAMELAPIIKVENSKQEKGTFMLTTVRMGGANFFNYSLAKLDDYMEIIPKEMILGHYKDEEHYSRRQLQVMQSSQDTAIYVSYKLAGKKIKLKDEGIMVTQTVEGMPADGKLQIGDIITKVDGQKVSTSEELIRFIMKKQQGEQIQISFLRNDREETIPLTLTSFPLTDDEKKEGKEERFGIGISTLTKRVLENIDPPIEIRTKNIGGPSAGLMFTLEIYNQLIDQDITKGYRIAGTGTINLEGNVGRIGGIHQKVVAAHEADADIFFAPNENGADKSNYKVALSAAKDIGTEMKIVPVDHVQDALDYLESMPPKSK